MIAAVSGFSSAGGAGSLRWVERCWATIRSKSLRHMRIEGVGEVHAFEHGVAAVQAELLAH